MRITLGLDIAGDTRLALLKERPGARSPRRRRGVHKTSLKNKIMEKVFSLNFKM